MSVNGKTKVRLDLTNEWKYDTLGLMCTPGNWCSSPIYIPVTKIKMTCGGGMGGLSWTVFAKEIPLDELKEDKMIIVDEINQHTLEATPKLINTKFVVDAVNDFDICYAHFSTTNTSYYGDWCVGKLIKRGCLIRLLNEYEHRS